ncbi:MAG: hypothetical protein ABIE03_07580 [Patescibacteria group bacterium]|nr:hypothetical protein [Patescibacteria group bacterium]
MQGKGNLHNNLGLYETCSFYKEPKLILFITKKYAKSVGVSQIPTGYKVCSGDRERELPHPKPPMKATNTSENSI